MTEANPSQLPFAEFAQSMQTSGAVSRIPSTNGAADLYTYSVYMNGPLSRHLPRHAHEYSYKDVTLQALTEKLKLDPLSARDNLKVAELVSVRSAWMSAVLETPLNTAMHSPEVQRDYAVLSEGMTHPWIQEQLERQRVLSAKLGPTLARAGVRQDLIPKEVSKGRVLAQTDDFTLQRTQDGEVVTHENRRLQTLPAVGSDVLVTYYRGAGQIVDDLAKARFSDPFIDPTTEDLAVKVTSSENVLAPRTVLFDNVQSYGKFVQAHGLNERLVQTAFYVRGLRPKTEFTVPPRKLVRMPYLDETSNCLAVDYKENHVVYTVLFESAKAMASLSRDFDLGARAISQAHRLESELSSRTQQGGNSDTAIEHRQSENDLKAQLVKKGFPLPDKSKGQDRDYTGPIVAATSIHVAQDTGRRRIVVHDIRLLDKLPEIGDRLNIRFKGGRGAVTDMVKSGNERGR